MNTNTPRTDAVKCKQSVMPATGFPRPHQCRFKSWKDGYCKIHHPDSVKARDEKQRARYEANRVESPYFLLSQERERTRQLETEVQELRGALEYWLPKKKPLDGFVSEEILAHQTMWLSARATLEKTK